MRIALVGFGKMGHMLKETALSRGHDVVLTTDPVALDADFKSDDCAKVAEKCRDLNVQGIIEFTHPSVVVSNISALVPTGIPLVVGTTGWDSSLDKVKAMVEECGSSFLYSSNFSIGVNIFYKIVEKAAALMNSFDFYDASSWEIHHNQKHDSPSGTALEIAKRVVAGLDRKNNIVFGNFEGKPLPEDFQISSVRLGTVPGTHTVAFDSQADTIELTHRARSRAGFALGAVTALEWLTEKNTDGSEKKGVFTTDDIFKDF